MQSCSVPREALPEGTSRAPIPDPGPLSIQVALLLVTDQGLLGGGDPEVTVLAFTLLGVHHHRPSPEPSSSPCTGTLCSSDSGGA